MQKYIFIVPLAVAFLIAASAARADLVIKITQGVSKPSPIAIVPFAWQGTGAASVDVAKVISDDLARSGLFAPLPVAKMLAQPTASADINFDNWKAVDVNHLVIGSIAPTGENAELRFRLFNVYTSQQLLGYVLPTTTDKLRFIAHVVSDMVYQKLTGTPGAFATRIAYIEHAGSGKSERWELVVADADGANAQVVVKSPGLLMSPSWSPDGQRIAYVEFDGQQSHIYIQNVTTGARQSVLAREGINSAPAFSPDGKKLAVVLSTDPGNADIYLLDLASGKLQQLTSNPAIDTEPTWMPGGQAIVFTSDRGGSPQIYEMRIAGGQARRLSWDGSYNARPVVSPDGKSIALVHREHGALRIGVLDPASGDLRLLTNGPLDRSPSFAPNGALILYDALDQGQHVLETVSVDSRVREELSGPSGGLSQPTWGPFPPKPAARVASGGL
ncbi:MAG: Tol-Pal system beta propeller repeat protein TolB [Gammaproteobacteria bacterium]